MFRKEPQRKALANLKSSERRRLLQTIVQKFHLPAGMAKESEDKVLPPVTKQTGIITHQGTKGTLYTDEKGTPVWFSAAVDMSVELIPTVYTLWKAPFLLPIVHTHPHVIEVLAGGANLMLPGSVPPFSDGAKKGAIVAIADTKDPFLVKAVGVCALDMFKIDRAIGKTGIAVKVVHTVDDALFGLAKPKIDPPAELDLEVKFKELEINEVDTETVEGEPESIPGPAATEAVEPKEVVTEQETTEDSKDEPAEESEEQLTTEDIDNFFKRSLMQTLTQSKLQPPLPSSQFMHLINSNLITSHPSIQIKKTSWKKSAKFLKAMEKSKFLKLKGKDDDLTIVSISNTTNNEELKNFVPYKVKKSQPSQQQPTPPKGSDTLTLTNYYKPTAPLRPIFNELDLDFISNFNTKSDVKDILNAYITKQNLVNPTNKKLILINGALSKLTKDAALGRDKLLPLFLSKFTEYYKLTTPGSDDNNSPPVKGSLPQVEIITETKIGRKLITRISKVEYFNIDIETFANELKVKCSGSTTIKPKVENPKFSEISVQGPHFKIVNELLTGKYGLNANWISFNDKSKSKKKRS